MSKNLPPSMGLYKKCCRGSYMHLYVFLEVTRHGFSGVYGVYWASLSYFLQNPVLAKRHTASLKASSADQKEKREAQKDIQTRKQRRRQNLVKPSVLQQGHERKLRRVATRGVVALFNAIRKHQKTASLTEEEEDKLAFHKNKMEEQKSGFLDLLKSTERTLEEGNKQSSAKKSKKSAKKGKQDEGENKQWSVFKDDFMMGARAKDWNKPESDSDEEDGWNFSSGALDGDNDDENL
eukprot:gb/GECG01006978.1/.p1 GENE.gb/GECG01006978.1/~~gb/GECG01006978.1/.p1  ORF type:complete len:236 (+),score=43.67 gb/GECG01006978.1/:1-708(+)